MGTQITLERKDQETLRSVKSSRESDTNSAASMAFTIYTESGDLGTGMWNPRVVLWAEAQGIELENLKRDLGEGLYCVGQTPWTVCFSQWIQGKWCEYRALCTHVPNWKEPCCNHCYNQEKFDTWLR